MLIYFVTFFFISILAFIAQARRPMPYNLTHSLAWNPLWLIFLFFFTIFIGLRFEVGGDWGSYLRYYNDFYNTELFEEFDGSADVGYHLLNWVASYAGLGISGVNFFCGFIFSIGLISLCRSLPRPLLALVAAFPYMIVVVAMGYSRQGIALGLAMLALVYLGREKKIWFVIFIIAATSFHKTAIVLLPVAGLAATKDRFWILVWLSLLGLIAYFSLLASSFERLYLYYVEQSYVSEGALIRLIMIFIPSLIILIWPHRLNISKSQLETWKVYAYISVGLFFLYFFKQDASTAVDRIALYMLPIQMVVFSYLPEFFGGKGETPQLIVLGVILYFFAVLMVWSFYSPYAVYWFPYKNFLLEAL
jgi:hypothetical protein|tara:strand:- start:12894 stop:13979 length:1086 start_codon:yes stop_codon:yes gene_type:complete